MSQGSPPAPCCHQVHHPRWPWTPTDLKGCQMKWCHMVPGTHTAPSAVCRLSRAPYGARGSGCCTALMRKCAHAVQMQFFKINISHPRLVGWWTWDLQIQSHGCTEHRVSASPHPRAVDIAGTQDGHAGKGPEVAQCRQPCFGSSLMVGRTGAGGRGSPGRLYEEVSDEPCCDDQGWQVQRS